MGFRVATFIGLVLVFPCPWYMLAVGGLLPLPVILVFGLSGGVVLVITLVHLAFYTWVFHRVARWVASVVDARHIRPSIAVILLLLALLVLSIAPIYGAGENLAAGGKLNRNAYDLYREALREVLDLPRVRPRARVATADSRQGYGRAGRDAARLDRSHRAT